MLPGDAQKTICSSSAKGYLLQAGICALCYASDDDMQIKLEQYKDIDLQFSGSREANLLDACSSALAACDDKAFATAIAEFDSLTRLDAWKTKMLPGEAQAAGEASRRGGRR